MSRAVRLALALVLIPTASPASAHEMRPSLLELKPEADGRVKVSFRVAYARNAPMELQARFPPQCRRVGAPEVLDRSLVRAESFVLDCGPEGLAGTVSVRGLARYAAEVILRVPEGTFVLRSGAASVELQAAKAGRRSVFGSLFATYVAIGVEHILLGPDHLLFVLGLVLLVGWRARQLLATTSAFTVAHSLTLALATLEWIELPSRAVESVIAASIVALAVELARPARPTLARRAPWLFALVCGLLHGFGFAGVLSEVGLPTGELPPALLGFNIGVELGQLAFVAAMLGAGMLAVRLRLERSRGALVYAIGIIGVSWVGHRALPIFLEPLMAR